MPCRRRGPRGAHRRGPGSLPQIRGALDEITTRLVEAADKLLVGPGKVKTAALVPGISSWSAAWRREFLPRYSEGHASRANPEGRGLTVMDNATQTLPVARGP